MGFFSALGLGKKSDVKAQLNPAVYDAPFGSSYAMGNFGGWNNWGSPIDRQEAMSVPAVSACRNLIVGIISGIPLETYSDVTGQETLAPSWVKQLDLRAPLNVTLAWITDSLIFFGQAFLRVTEIYADDQRPARFEFIQNNRVSTKLDSMSQEVDYYMINGERVPDSGIGSLVTIQSFDQGLLVKARRTIMTAIEVERAANIGMMTPQPTGHLKVLGADLPDAEIQGIRNTWNTARKNNSIAVLNSQIDYVTNSYSPSEMAYNDAIEELAAQIARHLNVPAHMINAEHNRSSTYQNVLDARKEFFAYTLQPYINCIENRFSMDDLTPRGTKVRFAVDETFLRANPLDRLQVTEKLLELKLITLPQAMEMEGLSPNGSGESDATNLQ